MFQTRFNYLKSFSLNWIFNDIYWHFPKVYKLVLAALKAIEALSLFNWASFTCTSSLTAAKSIHSELRTSPLNLWHEKSLRTAVCERVNLARACLFADWKLSITRIINLLWVLKCLMCFKVCWLWLRYFFTKFFKDSVDSRMYLT